MKLPRRQPPEVDVAPRSAAADPVDLPPDDGLEEPHESGEIGIFRRLLRPETIVSFLFSLAILIFFLTSIKIDFETVVTRMANANPILLGLAFVAYYLSFPVRGWRWQGLLVNAGQHRRFRNTFPPLAELTEMVFLSWFANCIVPAKLGDILRSFLLKRRVGFSFSLSMGTILVERLTDLLVLFGLLWVAGLIAFGGRMPPQLLALIVIGAALTLVILVGLVALRGIRPLAARLLPARLHRLYQHVEQGILLSLRPPMLPRLLLLTVLIWLLEGLRLYCVAAALGLQPPLSVTLFIALASSILTTVPFTPAGLGVVESAVVTTLLWFDYDLATAVSVSFLDRIISYWSIIAFGLVVYLINLNRGRLARSARPPDSR